MARSGVPIGHAPLALEARLPARRIDTPGTVDGCPTPGCPTCHRWAPRQDWQTAPGEPFPFRIVCPACGAEADVGDIGYRLGSTPPPQTAALAGERPQT